MRTISLAVCLLGVLGAGCGSVVADAAGPVCVGVPVDGGGAWALDGPAATDATGKDASLRVAFALSASMPLRWLSAVVEPSHGHAALPERLPWWTLTAAGQDGAFEGGVGSQAGLVVVGWRCE